MNAHQLLTQTRELLTDPKHWTQHAFGRTASGDEVRATDPQASCWCLVGATLKVSGATNAFDPVLREARRAMAPDRSLILYNDQKDTKHEDVLALLDNAIERTKPS